MIRPAVWNDQQRIVLFLLLVLVTSWLLIRLVRDRVTVPKELPSEGPRAAELADHLDLNTADAASLSAIPHLGEKKAGDIVAFREKFGKTHRGQLPFERMEDLYRVKGIGPATIAQMRPFVTITTRPATPATTQISQ